MAVDVNRFNISLREMGNRKVRENKCFRIALRNLDLVSVGQGLEVRGAKSKTAQNCNEVSFLHLNFKELHLI